MHQLQEKFREFAGSLTIPGAVVGVYSAGQERCLVHGVTSVENPLRVDSGTLFQAGSIGKTYTATALMRLVDRGAVELDVPVRRYVPELRLGDEAVAGSVTVAHLLDHTAGWEGDLLDDTGEGDDALARYVERMVHLAQVTLPGEAFAYNNAALALAGRVIEKVTDTTYEQAIAELLFEPLGLQRSFFFCNDVMTRRFAVAHHQRPDGSIAVARPWAFPRGGAPSGAIACPVGDLLAWARFHLGDGRTDDGARVLSEELLRRMQQPRMDIHGSALGDYVGLSWFLRDVDGVRLVVHDGGTNGQVARLVLVPERDWAIAMMVNCAPAGLQIIDELTTWALAADLGLEHTDPQPVALGEGQLRQYAGEYDSIALRCRISADHGFLVVEPTGKPDAVHDTGQDVAGAIPPLRVGLLPGPGDRYVVTEGPAKGVKGYFTRAPEGTIDGIHAGGRLLTRVAG